MAGIYDKILRRMRAHGKGKRVCTPKDFLDLGSRAAVDQSLSRLVKAGELRRIGCGLYDMPRISNVLKRSAPANMDAAIAAIARRDSVRIMSDGMVAAIGDVGAILGAHFPREADDKNELPDRLIEL